MQPATHKSLLAKIKHAITAFDEGRVAYASPIHVKEDIAELGLNGTDAYKDIIYQCLQLAEENPLACFRQPSPPKST